ncbi:TPA: hypothetical protein ACX6NV_000574 [Photobacterium damselae]
MKAFKVIVISMFISFVYSTIVFAEGTPDEYTPANEGVCDVLQGGTPSLYGLCVAFCEAQDHFDIEYPVTEDELESYLAANKRADVIYGNYLKRKTDNDPNMPCVVIQQNECPCWTQDELDLYTNSYMTFRDTSLGTRIFTRKVIFAVNGIDNFACKARFITNQGQRIERQLSLTVAEAELCKSKLRDKAVELGL